jgi:hypothetical protein
MRSLINGFSCVALLAIAGRMAQRRSLFTEFTMDSPESGLTLGLSRGS